MNSLRGGLCECQRVGRGLGSSQSDSQCATEQNLYWVWDETFADDGTTIHGNAGGAWTAFKSGGGTELSAPTLVDLRANKYQEVV